MYKRAFQEPKDMPSKRELEHNMHLLSYSPLKNIGFCRHPILESDEVKNKLQELLKKGFIRPSTSPFGSLIILVPNKDGTRRMFIDYRDMKNITLKNHYPLPMIKVDNL
jgi:hypothetical protein